MNSYKEIAKFITIYGIVKSLSFIAPILISIQVEVNDYGRFEYLLALGTILSYLMDFGFAGAYPYFILKLKNESYKSFFSNHFFFLAIFSQFISIVLYFIYDPSLSFIILSAAILSLQYLASSIFKSDGNRVKSILADGLFYYIINIYNIWLYIGLIDYKEEHLTILMFFFLIVLLCSKVMVNKKIKFSFPQTFTNYHNVISVSKGFLINGFLMLLYLNLPRIALEKFLNTSQVGIYSFFFRITYISLIFYQIFNIYFFQKFYTYSAKKIDFFFSRLLLVIIILIMGLYFMGTLIMSEFPTIFRMYNSSHNPLMIVLCFQSVFWITSSFYEGMMGRERLLKYNNISVIFILSLISILFILNIVVKSLFNIVLLHLVGFIILSQIQYFILKFNGFRYTMTQKINLIAILACTLYVFYKTL